MAAEYLLPRNTASSTRLDLQHYNWINQLGYHLHPSIPPSVGTTADSCIADVGTGTGLWAVEVANQRPASRVIGLDVDLSQTTASEWLPPNFSMDKIDMLSDQILEQYIEKFDIVHIRHFVIVTPNVQRLATNAMKLLKPGGYIQWSEYDVSRPRILKARPELVTEKLEKLVFHSNTGPTHLRLRQKNARQTWVSDLRTFLEDVGFATVVEERRRPNPYCYSQSMETGFMSYHEMSIRSMDAEQGDAFRKIVADAQEEVLSQGKGTCATLDWLTIVAWKPVHP